MIDADALKNVFSGQPPEYYTTAYITDLIDRMPTVQQQDGNESVLPRMRKAGEAGMINFDNTIVQLESMKRSAVIHNYKINGYPVADIIGDVLEMLKGVKEVSPVKTGYDEFLCGNCGESVGWYELANYGYEQVRHKYCPECGKRVKWDEQTD